MLFRAILSLLSVPEGLTVAGGQGSSGGDRGGWATKDVNVMANVNRIGSFQGAPSTLARPGVSAGMWSGFPRSILWMIIVYISLLKHVTIISYMLFFHF